MSWCGGVLGAVVRETVKLESPPLLPNSKTKEKVEDERRRRRRKGKEEEERRRRGGGAQLGDSPSPSSLLSSPPPALPIVESVRERTLTVQRLGP